jgi:hypothetical protein
MANFAKLDENNVVIDALVVRNEDMLDANGNEVEQKGIDILTALTGHSHWKQYSVWTKEGEHLQGRTPFRKNHAGRGHIYDATKDAFIPPKPPDCVSYVFNESKCVWEPPIPMPLFEGSRAAPFWLESEQRWVKFEDFMAMTVPGWQG